MSRQISQSVLDRFPDQTLIEKDRLQERRVQFIPYIIKALNNPKWGYLIKSGGKVQDDIVVDKVTMHHFDCLTAVDEDGKYRIKGAWKDQGIVPDKWKWGSINDYAVTPLDDEYPDDPIPEPNPNPNPEDNPIDLQEGIERIINQNEEILFILKKVFK